MALPQGINFRNTAGYVTDGANEHGEINTTATYPDPTAQGNDVGWEDAIGGTVDRSSTIDVRLAGIAYIISSEARYRIDLPSTGNHKVRLAAGDVLANDFNVEVELLDTTTQLAMLVNDVDSSANNTYFDAAGTEHSVTDWPTNNALAGPYNFSTTICRFKLRVSGAGANRWNHVYIESAGGGAPATRRYTLTTLGVG